MNRLQYFEIGFSGIKGNTCSLDDTVLLPKNGDFKSLSRCDANQNEDQFKNVHTYFKNTIFI